MSTVRSGWKISRASDVACGFSKRQRSVTSRFWSRNELPPLALLTWKGRVPSI